MSSLTPSSITVSSSAPRSMVVLAPISTSSPMRTLPSCGTLTQSLAVARVAETVGSRSRRRDARCSARRARTSVTDRHARVQPGVRAELRAARRRCNAGRYGSAPDHARRRRSRTKPPISRGCVDLRRRVHDGGRRARPGCSGGCGCSSAAMRAKVACGLACDQRGDRAVAPPCAASTITAPSRVRAQLLASSAGLATKPMRADRRRPACATPIDRRVGIAAQLAAEAAPPAAPSVQAHAAALHVGLAAGSGLGGRRRRGSAGRALGLQRGQHGAA